MVLLAVYNSIYISYGLTVFNNPIELINSIFLLNFSANLEDF